MDPLERASEADLIAVARWYIAHHPDARSLDDAAAVARFREYLTARRAADASVQTVAVKVVGAVLGGVLILAGIALVMGNPALAEKVLIALIAAASGFFAGRDTAQSKKPASR